MQNNEFSSSIIFVTNEVLPFEVADSSTLNLFNTSIEGEFNPLKMKKLNFIKDTLEQAVKELKKEFEASENPYA